MLVCRHLLLQGFVNLINRGYAHQKKSFLTLFSDFFRVNVEKLMKLIFPVTSYWETKIFLKCLTSFLSLSLLLFYQNSCLQKNFQYMMKSESVDCVLTQFFPKESSIRIWVMNSTNALLFFHKTLFFIFSYRQQSVRNVRKP